MAGSNFKAPVSSTLDAREIDEAGLIITGMCLGAPPTTAGLFVHGAQLVRTDSGTGVKALYENIGSTAVPSWNLLGDVTAGEITLAEGSILVGNSSGVATALDAKTSGRILVGNGTTSVLVAVSGDATLSSAGVVTVVGANAAFNVGTDVTLAKEVNHSIAVTTTTTAATAGGSLSLAGGIGATTGAGGAASLSGGVGGVSGAGGAASLIGGAAGTGSANAVGGQANVTGGAAQGTSAGGAVVLTSGASENGTAVNPGASGAISLLVGTPGTATTGVGGAGGAISLTGVKGGNSTGAASVAGAGSSIALTAGAGGNSSGGTDTGGAGGSITLTAGAGGTGATAGVGGLILHRSKFSRLQSTPAAKTTSATLTAAEVLSGIITVNQGAGGASALQLPLATDLDLAVPSMAADDSFDFSLINISTVAAEDATVTTNTGWTLVGNIDVASNAAATDKSAGRFRARKTGAGAWVLYRLA